MKERPESRCVWGGGGEWDITHTFHEAPVDNRKELWDWISQHRHGRYIAVLSDELMHRWPQVSPPCEIKDWTGPIVAEHADVPELCYLEPFGTRPMFNDPCREDVRLYRMIGHSPDGCCGQTTTTYAVDENRAGLCFRRVNWIVESIDDLGPHPTP